MEHDPTGNAAIAVAIALAAGMVAQALGRAVKIPGIVLLLGAGVLVGPDLLGIVQPEDLGPALHILVGFAVAVILFEGGMNLCIKRLRQQALVIRRLLTLGALITTLGGTVAAHLLMGWGWAVSILFGTLIMVTGPTVVTPLLRRIKVEQKIQIVLEGEGVLLDAIGAVIAVVALDVALHIDQVGRVEGFASGMLNVVSRLGFGLAMGLAGGFLIALLLRFEKVTQGLENVFTLAMVLALFQLSNHFRPESGIMAVVAAGLVMGNVESRVHRDLLEFKEQLTVMLIGMLFVLLAAGVRVQEVRDLGWPGVATVLALVFVVRPLCIFGSTWGTDLTVREKLFMSWLAPRGIVAAAIASIFAQQAASDFEDAHKLQALVFMVIAVTVLLQGLSGGTVARLLGLRRRVDHGYAILGANELGHALGNQLRDAGEDIVFLDSNAMFCNAVERDGFKVVFGNVLQDRTLYRAQLEDLGGCIAVTPNTEANLLFVHRAMEIFKVKRAYVAVAQENEEAVVRKSGAGVLFGASRDAELWAVRLRHNSVKIETWLQSTAPDPGDDAATDTPEFLLPLIVRRGKRVFPVTRREGFRQNDRVTFALLDDRLDEARTWLTQRGWKTAYETDEQGAAPEAADAVGTTLEQRPA